MGLLRRIGRACNCGSKTLAPLLCRQHLVCESCTQLRPEARKRKHSLTGKFALASVGFAIFIRDRAACCAGHGACTQSCEPASAHMRAARQPCWRRTRKAGLFTAEVVRRSQGKRRDSPTDPLCSGQCRTQSVGTRFPLAQLERTAERGFSHPHHRCPISFWTLSKLPPTLTPALSFDVKLFRRGLACTSSGRQPVAGKRTLCLSSCALGRTLAAGTACPKPLHGPQLMNMGRPSAHFSAQ